MWGLALVSSLSAGALIVRGDDEPTTKPARHATSRPAGIRVDQPYSKLTDLTDDEKSKISEIHKKALADLKAIRDKEDEDIRAVLTDDQKAQLDKLEAERREKMEEKNKSKKAAATEPAGG
jgi:Spy/CpxP family protein refolding chaperone